MSLDANTVKRLTLALKNQAASNDLTTQINYGAGVGDVTAGTVTASKPVVVDANKDIATFRHLTISGNFVSGSTTISETELGYLDGQTAGVATASKALILDGSKGIATITTATITTLTNTTCNTVNVDAGASGTAGSVDIFPTTASMGKLSITAADSAGNTTTTIVNASQSGARTYTIPDAGASASFMMTVGAQTASGNLTLGTGADLIFSGTTGQSEITFTDNLADALSVKITGGADMLVFDSTDSNEKLTILSATTQKLAFYGAAAVVQGAALTTQLTSITHTAPSSPDYALQNLVQNTGFGFATADEGNSLLSVVLNLQVRMAELEARLEPTTGVGLIAAN